MKKLDARRDPPTVAARTALLCLPDGIDGIDLVKGNHGGQKVSGFDVGVALSGLKSGVGTFGLRLNGSWALSAEQQIGHDDRYVSNLGHFINDGVVMAGYTGQHIIGKVDRRVGADSLWDVTGAWSVNTALTPGASWP